VKGKYNLDNYTNLVRAVAPTVMLWRQYCLLRVRVNVVAQWLRRYATNRKVTG
jgi:hypothetical protein